VLAASRSRPAERISRNRVRCCNGEASAACGFAVPSRISCRFGFGGHSAASAALRRWPIVLNLDSSLISQRSKPEGPSGRRSPQKQHRAGRSADHERLEACCRICDLVLVAVALHHPDVQLGSVRSTATKVVPSWSSVVIDSACHGGAERALAIHGC
jgi:hypothetical protein